MIDAHSIFLLTAALTAVIGLIFLIAVLKLNPFISLLLVSLTLALVAGMSFTAAIHSFEVGLGATLGHIAIIVALGTMLGKMLAESGGADQVAHTLIDFFGENRVAWAMMAIGLLVGLPCFFEVGFVLLIPIAFTVARRTGKSLILVALPLVAGLSVVHGLVPPHPAAMLAVTIFHANVGRTILYGLLVGIPCAVIAGPLYARFIAPRIVLDAHNPMAEQFAEYDPLRSLPGFGISMATVLLPVLLMLLGSWAGLLAKPGTSANRVLHLVGTADMALLVEVLISFLTLGKM